jgi:Fic family protein
MREPDQGVPIRMPSPHDSGAVNALLADPVFAALAEEAARDYIDWDELAKRPLPAGLSATDTWQLLTAVRRFGSTQFPIRDMRGRVYWYTLTRESSLCVDAIERHCRADSATHRAILHRHGRRFLVGSRIREAIAACQLDGVVVSPDEAESLLMSGRAPRNATDRLILNSHALLYELDDLADEPFSPELLTRLYERLIEGVDLSALERRPVRHGLTDRVESAPVTPEARARVIQQFCAYANGKTGDPTEPVGIKAHALLNTAQHWEFFPDFNGIVGRCIFRLFAAQRDYPVLGYLPISSLYQSWSEGRVESSVVRFSSLDIPTPSSETEVDYTPNVLTYLQISVVALDELLGSIARARRRDAEVRSRLEHDAELNYRQRSIIAHALANPDVELRIREHQTAHNVVYATARADLLDLVDCGYLRQELRGRAFVFLPEPDLPERLGGAEEA